MIDFNLRKEGMVPPNGHPPSAVLHHIVPRKWKKKSYTRAIDWWAFGILIYEMLCLVAMLVIINKFKFINSIEIIMIFMKDFKVILIFGYLLMNLIPQ